MRTKLICILHHCASDPYRVSVSRCQSLSLTATFPHSTYLLDWVGVSFFGYHRPLSPAAVGWHGFVEFLRYRLGKQNPCSAVPIPPTISIPHTGASSLHERVCARLFPRLGCGGRGCLLVHPMLILWEAVPRLVRLFSILNRIKSAICKGNCSRE